MWRALHIFCLILKPSSCDRHYCLFLTNCVSERLKICPKLLGWLIKPSSLSFFHILFCFDTEDEHLQIMFLLCQLVKLLQCWVTRGKLQAGENKWNPFLPLLLFSVFLPVFILLLFFSHEHHPQQCFFTLATVVCSNSSSWVQCAVFPSTTIESAFREPSTSQMAPPLEVWDSDLWDTFSLGAQGPSTIWVSVPPQKFQHCGVCPPSFNC